MNHHCSVIEIAGTGIAIEGKSGAGKTSLALGLIEAAKRRSIEACLICDDQALIEAKGGRLYAKAPDPIAGLVELRGYGVARMASKPGCIVRLVVRLVPDEEVERMPGPAHTSLLGIELPLVKLPERHEAQSVRIVLASLGDLGNIE
jgi:serine kinase of HPr protein (carbohydrate metabolism regulator)